MNKKIEGISDEFQDLGNLLNDLDFSNDADKEKIYKNSLNNINKKEGIYMIKKKFKKAGIIAASLILLVAASNPAYTVNAAKKMISEISFGKISFFQNTDGVTELDDCYKGKVFDKDGNEVTSYNIQTVLLDRTEKLYTKDGKEISHFKDGNIITVEDTMKDTIEINDKDKISEYASFDYKLPDYIPDGYEFKNAVYGKTPCMTNGKEYYIEGLQLNYVDNSTGNSFFIGETFSERPFSIPTSSEMEQIKINDKDGVLFKNNDIHWVMDDIAYQITSNPSDKDINLKIAESIK